MTSRHVVDTFYSHTLAMIEAGGFDMIGHFDKIGFNASYFQKGIEEKLVQEAYRQCD